MTRTAWCSAVVAVSSPEADPTSTGMSQRPCRCSPRPPSSSCRCSALTAAGRPRSSDGEWGEGAGGTRPRKGVRGWGAAATEPDPLPSPVCAPRRAGRSRAGVGGGSWGRGGGERLGLGEGRPSVPRRVAGPGLSFPGRTWTSAPKKVKGSAFRGALVPWQDLPILVPTPLEEAPNAPTPPPPWGLGSDRAREPPAPGVWPGA